MRMDMYEKTDRGEKEIWGERGSKRESGGEEAHTAAIELQRALQLDLLLHIRGLGVGFLSSVEPVDVRLVVLGMVQVHDLLRDVGFESLCRIYEPW